MQITIQVKNAQLVAKGLANIRAEIPRISLATIEKAANKIIREMQKYPPERSGQKYVRTYKFKNAWKAEKSVSGFRIENNATGKRGRYGTYVVGDFAGNNQAWMHVGRWLLFRDVVEHEVTLLPPMVENHIRLKIIKEGLA